MTVLFDSSHGRDAKPPRPRLPLATIAVALTVVAVVVGIVVARSGEPTSDGVSGQENADGSTSVDPGAHDPEVMFPELSRSEIVPGEGGNGEVGGVPVGFPGTEQGAAAAAASHLRLLMSAEALDPQRYDEILAQIGGSAWRGEAAVEIAAQHAERLSELGLGSDGTAPQGKVAVAEARLTWGAFRVREYTEHASYVDIWYYAVEGLIDAGEDPDQVLDGAWRTTTVYLERIEDDEWRLGLGLSTESGPEPAGDGPPSARDRAALLSPYDGWQMYANAELPTVDKP